ncbi:MAG: Multidrug resistance protein MdtA [Elusimicrobia bacterium]|nr:Multidrug resistance protein MdtA [Elusimicrobiota bacterium]
MAAGIVLVCLLLAGVRWFSSYSSSARSKSEKQSKNRASETPVVAAFVCKKVNFTDELVLTGTMQGGARIEFRFNRDGRIQKLNYRVGDNVKRGAVVAELETGEAYLKLQQAESELSQVIDLYRSGAIAKPRLTQAQLAAELARKEYDRSFIRAPRDGALGELNVEVGDTVTPQNTVATLVSIENVFVEMGVIERDLGKLHLGQSVHVEVETYPGAVFKGKIASIAPQVEGASRTRTVRAEIPNGERLLLPGMFARAYIFIQEKPNTLVVPAAAIRSSNGKHTVYGVRENNKIQEVPVEIGYESSDYTEILSGVGEGDKVVASLPDNLRDGLSVEVIEEKEYQGRHSRESGIDENPISPSKE